MKVKSWWEVLKQTVNSFSEHRVLRLSAAMAYYAIFSIGPLLVLIVGLAGLVFGEDTVKREVTGQLQGMVGEKSAKIVESMMSAQKSGSSLIATIVGGIGLILGAAGVFGQLQDALNTIWEVQAKPGAGILGFIRQRFLSMAMVLGIGFLLLVSMALSAFINIFAGEISNMISLPEWVVPAFNALASFLVITVLFALIFKVLPDVKVRWSDVLDRRNRHLVVVHPRQVCAGSLPRPGGNNFRVRSRGRFCFDPDVHLLLVGNFICRGGIDPGICASPWRQQVEPSKYAVPVGEVERAHQGIPKEGAKQKDRKPSYQPRPDYAPAQTQSSKGSTIMSTQTKTKREGKPQPLTFPRRPPLEQIKGEPWSFVGLALTMGIAAGLMFRIKTLRKAVKAYSFVRRYT